MSNGKGGSDQEKVSTPHDSDGEDDSDDDESKILEESPCGRWHKRSEEVQQQEVPGIDHAFLAMDTEEGVEVVWNEVQFSEKKSFKTKQDELKQVFDNLIDLDHANIAKLHKYWFDVNRDAPRVIFITEYMSSGSLKQFLLKAKKKKVTDKRSLKAWKRWTTQILSAVSYLHAIDPPIIHGNLTLDKIFLQHNGLIKISSVAPDAIHNHVRTCKEQLRNMHYIAPEYDRMPVTPAVDVYSFGICALEIIAPDGTLPMNGDSGSVVITEEMIQKAIESLEDPSLKDFISVCLTKDPIDRPTAQQLFFHPCLFEVQSLKLLSAHALVSYTKMLPNESVKEEMYQSLRWDPQAALGAVRHTGPDREDILWKYSQVPSALELEKFIEDVKNGVYPIHTFAQPQKPPQQQHRTGGRAASPEVAESTKSESPEPMESRYLLQMSGCISAPDQGPAVLTIQFKMADKMNRHVSREIAESDSAAMLAQELVEHRFINEADYEKVKNMIEEIISDHSSSPVQQTPTATSQQPAVGAPVPSVA